MVGVAFTYSSLDIPGLPLPGLNQYQVSIAFYGQNGTLIKLSNSFTTIPYAFNRDLIYHTTTGAFYFTFHSNSGPTDYLYKTYPNMSSTLISSTTGNADCRALSVVGNDLACVGTNYISNTAQGYIVLTRYSLTNFSATINDKTQLSVIGTQDVGDCRYDPASDAIYITGSTSSEIVGFPSQSGNGAIFGLRWFMSNNSVTTLVRYGQQLVGLSGGGIGFDQKFGNLVVSGFFVGPFGDYDAILLRYARNLTLLETIVIGGGYTDGASTVILPYALVSVDGPADSSFGDVKGPALLKFDFGQSPVAPALPVGQVTSLSKSTAVLVVASLASTVLKTVAATTVVAGPRVALSSSGSGNVQLTNDAYKTLDPVSLSARAKPQASVAQVSTVMQQGP